MAADGAEIDLLTIKERLERAGKLAEVGGVAYVAGLVDHIPDIANVERYAKIVKDKATLRRLVGAGNKIMRAALDTNGADAEAVVSFAEGALHEVSAKASNSGSDSTESAGAVQMANSSMKRYEERLEAPCAVTGIDTGYDDLNLYTYGYQRGALTLICARSGVGKTTFGYNAAFRVLRAKPESRAGYFSLEMPRHMLEDRMLSMLSGVPSAVIKTGISSDKQVVLVAKAAAELAGFEGRFFGNGNILSISQITGEIRRLHKRHRLDIAFVDYIQLLEPDDRRARGREQEVSALSKGLLRLAKELDIAIIPFAQFNRSATAKDERPVADVALRESDALYHDARTVITLDRPRLRDFDNSSKRDCKLDLYFDKNGDGPRGQIEYHFDGPRFSVEEGPCRAGCMNFKEDKPAQERLII